MKHTCETKNPAVIYSFIRERFVSHLDLFVTPSDKSTRQLQADLAPQKLALTPAQVVEKTADTAPVTGGVGLSDSDLAVGGRRQACLRNKQVSSLARR